MAIDEKSQDDVAIERLVAWVDGIDLPMFVLRHVDGDRVEFVHANAALGRVANVATSIFPGNTAYEVFPARLAERLDGNYRQCLRTDVAYSYEECVLIEDRETWWQTTLSKPIGFHDRVVLGVAIPITEHKGREFAAAESLADMAAQFDELRLFSTMAAHDARGPLATVSSLIELVLEDFEDMGDGKAELLSLAANTVHEALTQITATLQRARSLQTDRDVRNTVDLGRLCSDIAAMIDPEMHLTIDVPQTRVECDEVMVQMGVRNLMSNAARFCEHHITVHVTEDRTRGMLSICVTDDGPGLPDGITMEDLTKKGVARDGVHGFGLSAISKLVSSRGGRFEVVGNSMDDALPGARFRMVLPGQILEGSEYHSARQAAALNGAHAALEV